MVKHWLKESLLTVRNAVAIYLILWSVSLLWFNFYKVANLETYQKFIESLLASQIHISWLNAQYDFLYLKLPLFSVGLALGLRLFKLRQDKPWS